MIQTAKRARKAWNKEDLTGRRFSRLRVIESAPTRVEPSGAKATVWLCQCDCGTVKEVRAAGLKSGSTTSCGCYQAERTAEVSFRHGKAKRRRPSVEYTTWTRMITRCTNANLPGYADYGGRGITVCDRWRHSFQAFLDDMGLRPSPSHSLDRRDNNRGYEPDNCHWATDIEQCNNRRSTYHYQYQGATMTAREIWETSSKAVPFILFGLRMRKGWDTERALTAPPHSKRR